jgi:hypothetical protein
LAALAHGSIVAQAIGMIVGILVYLTQREKSRYVAFQSLQADVYQLLNFTIILGLWLVWEIFYGMSIFPFIQMTNANPNASPPSIFWIALISVIIPLLYTVLITFYGLWDGLQTWLGKDFRYMLIGAWLERSGF